nr:hypothetical protein [Tanacetum cinerariifolium]
RIPNQPFDELPFEEEILAFLRALGHSGEIKKITDVNINKLHQPWRSFAAVINKCLSRKYEVSYQKKPDTDSYLSQASGSGADEGTSLIPGVLDVRTYECDEEISWKSSDEDDDNDVQQSEHNEDINNQSDDESHDDQEDDDDQDDEDDDQTDSDNNSDDFVHPKFSTHDEEAKDEECFGPIVQTPSHMENSNDEGNDEASHGMNVGGDEGSDAEDDDNELYGDSSSASSQFVTSMLNPSPDTSIDSLFKSTPWVDVPVTTTVEPLLLTTLTLSPPFIPTISQVQQAPAPSPATAPSTSLQDLLNFAENEDFLKKLHENIEKIIKEQVKEQVKELKLKKILIKKMKSNKSIHRSNKQRNLYKALVDAYECDKIILDTYGDMVSLKRRCDDEDKDEEPSAGSDRGSKRRRARKEPESTKEPMHTTLDEPSHQEFETGVADDQPVTEASQHPKWFQKQTKPPTPDRAWNKTLPAIHESLQPWISDLAKQANFRT